ncbi:MAG: nuclear transport factor 2 family protein [Balneolaceae bacterium]|nr:nuclear transport factor 2 family protein [Balneolaceae bacterium]MBO6547037.1 nuclear transport factor 2 family protein [Balneolaceae bacterium]MBO6648016.1 nuclear transport factor 2 family protein [Balneolaceae bacterium]
MKKIILSLFLLIITVVQINAQVPEREVQAIIETLFDGMRAGDSAMVASAFTRDAVMQTVAQNQSGEVVVRKGDLNQFLTAVGTPHEQIWDEKIGGYEIKIDGELATAWTPYQFYLGDNFSHCGVNSFQLAKLGGEWKIIYIVDTRRRTNCIE